MLDITQCPRKPQYGMAAGQLSCSCLCTSHNNFKISLWFCTTAFSKTSNGNTWTVSNCIIPFPCLHNFVLDSYISVISELQKTWTYHMTQLRAIERL